MCTFIDLKAPTRPLAYFIPQEPPSSPRSKLAHKQITSTELEGIRGIAAFSPDSLRGDAESKQSENKQLRKRIKLAEEACERTKTRFLNSLAIAEKIRRECEREKGACAIFLFAIFICMHVCMYFVYY